MIWWDIQLKMRMNEMSLRLYKRYVDDINVGLEGSGMAQW